jgi:hypothetical protein
MLQGFCPVKSDKSYINRNIRATLDKKETHLILKDEPL